MFSATNESWNTKKKPPGRSAHHPFSTCSTCNTGCPGGCCNSPYDLLNRLNRRRLLRDNDSLTRSITMEDYRIGPVAGDCFDLFFRGKQHK